MKAKMFGSAAVLSAALLALAGCGSGGGGYGGGGGYASSAAPSATASSGAAASSPVSGLKVADSKLGKIIVSSTGMTVYQYTKDVKDSGTSNCTGGCLKVWPPVLTTSATPTLQGVTGKVGTITTPEGKQVTVNGLPIYYWASDTAPGDVTGQGVQGLWYVVAPNGTMIK